MPWLAKVVLEEPFGRPWTMSLDGPVASAPWCWHTSIGHNLERSCAKLVAKLGVVRSQDIGPCLRLGQKLARATDLRPCKTAFVVACCRSSEDCNNRKSAALVKTLRDRACFLQQTSRTTYAKCVRKVRQKQRETQPEATSQQKTRWSGVERPASTVDAQTKVRTIDCRYLGRGIVTKVAAPASRSVGGGEWLLASRESLWRFVAVVSRLWQRLR